MADAMRLVTAARCAALLGAAAGVCACAVAPSAGRIPAPALAATPLPAAVAPPAAAAPLEPSSDWRGLVSAPFGSSLRQLPFPVHEALVFHEPGAVTATADDQECYRRDRPPPFLGLTPSDSLLCFRNDRLSRVEVTVTPPATAAQDAFERWCDRWLQGTEVIERDPTHCEGRGAEVAFRAWIESTGGGESAPGGNDGAAAAVPVWSMIVRDATPRGGAEIEKP